MNKHYPPHVLDQFAREVAEDVLTECDTCGRMYDDYQGRTCCKPVKIVIEDQITDIIERHRGNSLEARFDSEDLCVRVQSWSARDENHKTFRSLEGRRLRITIETIE